MATSRRIGVWFWLGCLTVPKSGWARDPAHTSRAAEETTETEVVVTAARPPAPDAAAVLLATEAACTAGNQGDAGKVVQSLPGVARPSTNGEPVVWGSAPNETGIFIDEVPLPSLYHGSGLRSIVPTTLLSAVRLTPGAYDLKLGRFLGGAIELTTTDALTFVPRLNGSVDALDISAEAVVPLTQEAGLRLGARYGYVDRWLAKVLGPTTAQAYAVPSYVDAHAMGHWLTASGDEVKLVFLTANDASRRTTTWVDHERRSSVGRLYATYDHRSAATQGQVRVTPYVGYDTDASTTTSYGADSGIARTTRALGLRVDTTHTWDILQLNGGLDARAEWVTAAQHGSLTVPPREGDGQVFGLPPGRDYIGERVEARRVQVAPYTELDLEFDTFRLRPGLRLETNVTELNRGVPATSTLPDTGATRFVSAWLPRFAVSWRPTSRVHWFSVLSRHIQPPDAVDLGTLTGNPQLLPARATHLAFGETTRITPALSLQVTLFQKWLTDLATRSPSPIPQPGRLLISEGRGRAWGAQTFVQVRESAGWSGWLGITVSSSRRRDAGETDRPFDYDQPLSLTWVVNKHLDAWQLGARVRASSGFPRARVTSAYADLQLDRFDPVLSTVQWWRLPAFFALDLRAERRLRLGNEQALFAYAEVLNATNHANVEDVVYSSDYTDQAWLLGMPLLAFFGLRMEL